ncbi:MAG: thioesterase family protein [Clostridiales bacterium]|nr:thioesterase family protein [Clostridiales bacterium]
MFTPGITGKKELTVTEAYTARSLNSGALPVLGTPMLVALMEGCAHESVLPCLEKGQGTVGTGLDIQHLAPTPVGGHVRAESLLVKVEGRLLTFEVRAYDEAGLIGQGTHTRCIISEDRFMQKAQSRLETK